MRKEILFAILAGALFGLVIAFGIWKANSSIKPGGVQDISEGTTGSSTPTSAGQLGITIAKPDIYEVLSDSSVTIDGITKPNAWLSVSGEKTDYILKANEEGSFSLDTELVSGINEIIFTAFDENGNSVTEKLPLVYSSEFASSTTNNENE